MIRAIAILHLRRLVRVRLRTVVAVVAVAAGSSLALSVVTVRSSVDWSLVTFGRQLAGPAPLRVVGAVSSGGLEQQIADRLGAVPGVAVASPVVQVSTVVRTRHGRDVDVVALGLDCRTRSLVAVAPCTSQIAVSPALRAALSPGSWMETATGVVPLTSAVTAPGLAAVAGGNAVVLDLAEAQHLFDRAGRVDAVYVVPQPSVPVATLARRLAGVAGPQNGVLGASDPPPEIGAVLVSILPLLTVLALLAASIAAVLVYNVVSLSLEQRRHDDAIAGALGAPPVVLASGPVIEAAAVGVVGGVLGAAGGRLLAGPTVHDLSDISLHSVGVPVVVHTTVGTYVAGMVLGLVIGLVAAARPLRRVVRAGVVAELTGRDRPLEGRRRFALPKAVLLTALIALSLVVGWIAERHGAIGAWQVVLVVVAFLVCVTASVLAVGYWTPISVGRAAMGEPRRAVVRLALANVVREPGRSAVVAVAIAASVGVALMTASYDVAIHDGIARVLARSSTGHGLFVATSADNGNANADGRVPGAAVHRLARLPGVERAEPLQVVLTGHTSSGLELVESSDDLAGAPPVDVGAVGGARYRRGEVMVGAGLARRLHLSPGSTFSLDTPAGLAPVTVEGVWENGDFGGENVTMTTARFTGLFGPRLPAAVVLVAASGTSPAQLRHRALSAGLPPDLVFSTPSRVLHDVSATASSQLAPFWALQRALLLVAFISVLCTLLLAGLQRRREHGLLAAVGLSPGEQFGVVCGEALAVSVVAVVLGTLMGAVDMGSLVQVTPLLVGYHDPYRLDLAALAVYVPLAIAVAVVASLWPAWRASRLAVVRALQYE